MGNCEIIDSCPFFLDQMGGDSDQNKEMKEKYCKNNNLNCARYMIESSLGKDKTPDDLFPHEKDKAYMFIAQNS
ncbi:MAG: hypothetical protein JEY91_02360 [Spirochaetaceae bacterium]|nr:hypothetical protein [Spirochaetaceae bacterium]